jgi:hypothetical protein
MKSIATTSFESPINREYSSSSKLENLSPMTKSTLELFEIEEGSKYMIEWDIPELEETEHIGIFCYDTPKEVSDYDGVFEVPKEAIKLLEDNGFNVDYLKD